MDYIQRQLAMQLTLLLVLHIQCSHTNGRSFRGKGRKAVVLVVEDTKLDFKVHQNVTLDAKLISFGNLQEEIASKCLEFYIFMYLAVKLKCSCGI